MWSLKVAAIKVSAAVRKRQLLLGRVALATWRRLLGRRIQVTAYLGRELAKAEAALSIGITYEQDAALGQLATSQQWEEPHKMKESDCECSKTSTCTP
jgi:hypothetical protein